jgi:hypothetical protein
MSDSPKKPPLDMAMAIINQSTVKFFDRVASALGLSHDGKRDIYDIYGYPKSLGGSSGFEKMYSYCRRQGIANRLTFGMAKRCWRDGFNVLSDEEDKKSLVLTEEIKKLNRKGLAKKLEQADILNRIGRFSVLLVGVPDGRDLIEEVGVVRGDGFKSIFFKAYAYDGITIHSYETDILSPRFNLPLIYSVQRGQTRGDNEKDNSSAEALLVHWSRIVHLNENALDSEIEGMGYLEPIFNRILDLDKACGGSSEAYFRNAKGKIAFEVDKDFASSLVKKEYKDAFQEGAENFTNQFKDHITALGSKVSSIDTPHASPLDTVKVLLWEISGYSGFPIRILTGEGSGQLAGSEDQLAVNQVVADRQRIVCTSWLINVLEILQKANMLTFDESWVVDFPLQTATTEEQEAEINNKNADTLNKVVDAKTKQGGDGIKLGSALAAFGLGEIKHEDIDLDSEPLDDNEALEEE